MKTIQPTKHHSESSSLKDEDRIPLQLRLRRQDVRAIKVAAAENDQTISDFMLACFRSWQRAQGGIDPTLRKPKR